MAERKRKKKVGGKKHHAAHRGHPSKKRAHAQRRTHVRSAGTIHRRTSHGRRKRPLGKTASAGALPLVDDMSPQGRRRLKLAQKLGLKVR